MYCAMCTQGTRLSYRQCQLTWYYFSWTYVCILWTIRIKPTNQNTKLRPRDTNQPIETNPRDGFCLYIIDLSLLPHDTFAYGTNEYVHVLTMIHAHKLV